MHRSALAPLLLLMLMLAGLADSAAAAAPVFVEVGDCRPSEEDGEFLQRCVKLAVGRRAGKLLGPGSVAPGGQAAAVFHHRRYGRSGDRVTVRIYGGDGRLEASYPMAGGGEEFPLHWAPRSSRFLAWVEVDGRGGQLRVVDRRRRRFVLSALSPLEEWPIFAPSGSKLLLPVGGPAQCPPAQTAGPSDPCSADGEVVRALEICDLRRKGSRQVVLRAEDGEELVHPRWVSPSVVQAQRRKLGESHGKTVQGRYR